jgi:hypothetical protein
MTVLIGIPREELEELFADGIAGLMLETMERGDLSKMISSSHLFPICPSSNTREDFVTGKIR